MFTKHVYLVSYDPDWPVIAEREMRSIAQVLPSCSLHHFGSTSIPGCSAKPIVDILMEFTDRNSLLAAAGPLSSLGYDAVGMAGVPDRDMFIAYHKTPKFHLSCFPVGHWQIHHNLTFRDELRRSHALRDEYVVLKKQLAKQFPDDINGYSSGKTAFIVRHGAEKYARLGNSGSPPSQAVGTRCQVGVDPEPSGEIRGIAETAFPGDGRDRASGHA